MPQLAEELRRFLIESVSRTGGHLSSNLGTVELTTIALHAVHDTPEDRLVWDVGHQCYAHKVLTGGRAGMDRCAWPGRLRLSQTLESPHYDTFGVGHSSTSISAALGMALAAKHKGGNAQDRGSHRRRRHVGRHGLRKPLNNAGRRRRRHAGHPE